MLKKISKTTCLFVQPTSPTSRYLLVRQAEGKPELIRAGALEHGDSDTLVQRIAEQLKESGNSVTQAALLLSRGDLEVHTQQLPPADELELPALVASSVAQQSEDVASVTDFVIQQEHPEGDRDVLSFTLPEDTLQTWVGRFRQHRMRLAHVTVGGMGAIQLLNRVARHPSRTSVVVTTTDQDTDLAVVEDGRPLLFRTIPKATVGEEAMVDRLGDEVQRTLTLIGHPDDESTRIYLMGTVGDQKGAAEQLSKQLKLSVSLLNPFDQLAGEHDPDKPSRFANLIGTACAWHRDSLQIDLLNPRQAPKPPSPWGKVALWSGVAAAALGILGYVAWDIAEEQRWEIEQKQAKLRRLVKPAQRSLRQQQLAAAVASWRSSDIAWLDELLELSQKLPSAEDVTVQTMTMTAAGQNGQINMALRVSQPEVRLAIEESVRDKRHAIQNQRVTDSSNPRSSAWQYQTSIRLRGTPPPELKVPEPPPKQTDAPKTPKAATVAVKAESQPQSEAASGSPASDAKQTAAAPSDAKERNDG